MRLLMCLGMLSFTACGANAPPTPPAPPPLSVIGSADGVHDLLKQRVTSFLPAGRDDFQVFVTKFGYEVGTLVPVDRGIAVNDEACKPSSAPGTFKAPNLFPTIAMKAKAAFELGLNGAEISKLGNFGVNVGNEDTVTLSISDAAGQFLLDDQLRATLAKPSCIASLKGRQLLMVRGYISGKRTYLLQRDRLRNVKIGFKELAGLKIDAPSSTAVSLSEQSPTPFLQIVSVVTVPTDASQILVSAPPMGPSVACAGLSAPICL